MIHFRQSTHESGKQLSERVEAYMKDKPEGTPYCVRDNISPYKYILYLKSDIYFIFFRVRMSTIKEVEGYYKAFLNGSVFANLIMKSRTYKV